MANRGSFKPGEINNPFGNLPVGDDLKYARKMTRQEFERQINQYLHMKWSDVEKAMSNAKELPASEVMILSILVKAINEGDEKRMNFLIERTIGSIVRKIHVKAEQEIVPKNAPVPMTPEERVAMLDRLKQSILDQKKEEPIDVTPAKD